MSHRFTIVASSLLLLAAACAAGPVAWQDVRASGEGAAAARDTRLALDGAGRAHFAAVASAPAFAPAGACPGSVRVARATAREWHAAWFAPRPDGSVTLLSARSDDGGRSWGAPVVADARESGARAGRGCARPAPSIAADSSNGYVHIVYFLDAPEGSGLFFVHSMDDGGMFHAPVAIVYGDRPGRASVAAAGDRVAVAYEDPNSEPTAVWIALSRTQGHIFEARLPVSGGSLAAVAPDVALGARHVAVSWVERAPGAAEDGHAASGTRMLRTGVLQ